MERRGNPDLLFPEIMLERAEKVADFFKRCSSGTSEDSLSLDRVTLFVTHRCNLACVYCNGPHLDRKISPQLRKRVLQKDLDLEQYVKLLNEWESHGLKHLHFTGGEATVHPQIVDFVRLAKEKKIALTITTNGTAKPELYQKLVEAGLSEVRISIDSTVPENFDRIVQRAGAYQKVEQTIQTIVRMRDEEKKDLYLIFNACVGSFNVGEVKFTLENLEKFRPNAIKLLVIAEEAETVRCAASREIVNDLLAYVKESGRKDELLERKIRSLFRKDALGLKSEAAQREMKRCFVPLTERTADPRHIYPCSIYVRYKGKPLSSIKASFEEQQRVIQDFVENHDCRRDTICLDNCTNCCKEYNLKVNQIVEENKKIQRAREREVITINQISREKVEEFLKTYQQILAQEVPAANPFILLKPFGRAQELGIKEYLQSQGLKFVDEKVIYNWPEASLYLYFTDPEDAEYRLARNEAHYRIEPEREAKWIILEPEVPEGKLKRVRKEVRGLFGEGYYFWSYQSKEFLLKVNSVHVPDYENLVKETKVLDFFLKK